MAILNEVSVNSVLVSNIPAPYREPVFEEVSLQLAGNFSVFYCQQVEPDRKWTFRLGAYQRVFLIGKTFTYNRIYAHHVHLNLSVWKELSRVDPQVVITNGYNPTHLLAMIWTILHRRVHVAMTDGWLKSEEHLSFVHRLIRKVVLRRTSAFIGASNKSRAFFCAYGASDVACFTSQLCGNNEAFLAEKGDDRTYDIMFSGQFIARKMPAFFCEVAKKLKYKRGSLRVLLIGDGPLRTKVLETLRLHGIDYNYPGFLSQEELPAQYALAKLFLFPTLQECWGVVVNEACAAGTPVITCDNTAVDGELVFDGFNGRVLPLNAQIWADAADQLLNDKERWALFSKRSRQIVAPFTYHHAAQGIVDAVQFAASRGVAK